MSFARLAYRYIQSINGIHLAYACEQAKKSGSNNYLVVGMIQ